MPKIITNLTIDECVVELNNVISKKPFDFLEVKPENTFIGIQTQLDNLLKDLNKSIKEKLYNGLIKEPNPMMSLFAKYRYAVASYKAIKDQVTGTVLEYKYVPETEQDAKTVLFNLPDFIKYAKDKSVSVTADSTYKALVECSSYATVLLVNKSLKGKPVKVSLSDKATKLVASELNAKSTYDDIECVLKKWLKQALISITNNGFDNKVVIKDSDIYALLYRLTGADGSPNKIRVAKATKIYNELLKVGKCKLDKIGYEVTGFKSK